ncbi:MAG: energy transducer TonB [candidate division WOR-3 bacterium]
MEEKRQIREWDWDSYYAISFRVGMVLSLAFTCLSFVLMPKEVRYKPYVPRKEVETIMEQLPPELQELTEPPPVERPKLAVEAEKGEEAEEATIAPTEFKEVIAKKAEEVEIPVVPYWKVEEKPKPIYIPKPSYPERARQAGIEGQVVVKVLLDIDGSVMEVELLKSSGNEALDEAALNAARQAKFTPAKQREIPVRVWVSIPFNFSLRQ